MTVEVDTLPRILSLIDGAWVDGGGSQRLHSPYDGRPAVDVVESTLDQVDRAVAGARRAFESWRRTPAYERAKILAATARLMGEREAQFVDVMCRDTGKTVRDGRAEVARTVSTMEVSAEEAKRIGGEVVPMEQVLAGLGKTGFAVYEPMGVVAGIAPFNAPLNLAAHKLGPALAAGDALVLKPHPQGSSVAALLGEIALEAGVPPGVFNIVHGGVEVGNALTTHPDVALINFTGSGRVAEQIVRNAGLKRTMLELGGNAPTIVHSDANWERAAELLVGAAFGLSGQSCVSTQRIYVHASIEERFTAALVERARALRVGDPRDPETNVGPLNTLPAADRICAWIDDAVAAGARLHCGGRRDGVLVWPTVLSGVSPAMKVVCDEVFGPVVSVIPYEEIGEALRAANATPWGLKAGIFTESLTLAMRAARELEYGTVNINAPSRSRTDHEPSGGVKASGWGREGPRYAIREMSNLKMVSVHPL
ncbi:aldehyde dehydrogenase family protein [bacterium]|nr:MAG: aldehyde dehydrogenase family protein [bacterium]